MNLFRRPKEPDAPPWPPESYTYAWSRPKGLTAIVSGIYATAHTSIGELDTREPTGYVMIVGNLTTYDLELPRQKTGYDITGATFHVGETDMELDVVGHTEAGQVQSIKATVVTKP